MAMSDATLATKSSELKKLLERTIEEIRIFKSGDEVRQVENRIREIRTSEEYKEIKDLLWEYQKVDMMLEHGNMKQIEVMLKGVGYLSTSTDMFLCVLEKHKIEPTDTIITKFLECASYQKWQELKGEAFGNNTKKNDKYIVSM